VLTHHKISLKKFLYVMAMIENLVTMLESVVTTLGGKMTIMETLFDDLG